MNYGNTREGLHRVRVDVMERAADDVLLVRFNDPSGAPLPAWAAGSHIDVHLKDGVIRQYSLLRAPDPGSYLIGVRRDPAGRGGSSFVHNILRVGDHVAVSSPRNHFALDETSEHTILIAGGIGITPIVGMVQRLAELGRSWQLHFAARSRSSAPLLPALAPFDSRVHLYLDKGSEPRMNIADIVQTAPPGTDFYCCGPASMLSAFEAATQKISPDRVHVERFGALQERATDGGFDVVLNRTKRVLHVASGQSILDAVLDAGIDCNYACMQGTCGSCETRVLSGNPDHRDGLQAAELRNANTTMLICCSGSHGPELTLDL
jgi:vanillate O-demethylase ferredoxin subunit